MRNHPRISVVPFCWGGSPSIHFWEWGIVNRGGGWRGQRAVENGPQICRLSLLHQVERFLRRYAKTVLYFSFERWGCPRFFFSLFLYFLWYYFFLSHSAPFFFCFRVSFHFCGWRLLTAVRDQVQMNLVNAIDVRSIINSQNIGNSVEKLLLFLLLYIVSSICLLMWWVYVLFTLKG